MSEPDTNDETEQDAAGTSATSSLFDLRLIIGGLFLLYGVVLFVVGLMDGEEAKKQAADIDINVWTGLGMAATGLVFLAWMLRRPLQPETGDKEQGQEDQGSRPS